MGRNTNAQQCFRQLINYKVFKACICFISFYFIFLSFQCSNFLDLVGLYNVFSSYSDIQTAKIDRMS